MFKGLKDSFLVEESSVNLASSSFFHNHRSKLQEMHASEKVALHFATVTGLASQIPGLAFNGKSKR